MSQEPVRYWVSHLYLYASEATLLPCEQPGVPVYRAEDYDALAHELAEARMQCGGAVTNLQSRNVECVELEAELAAKQEQVNELEEIRLAYKGCDAFRNELETKVIHLTAELAASQLEVERLAERVKDLESWIDKGESPTLHEARQDLLREGMARNEAEQRLARVEGALRFYANEKNYQNNLVDIGVGSMEEPNSNEVYIDHGKQATQALEGKI